MRTTQFPRMQRALVKVTQPSFIGAHRFLSARHVAFWPGFVSNMAEKEEFTDIRGKPIKLSCQNYSPLCREFTISSCKLSLVRVMVLTCGVWLLAYAGFYLTQNTAVLSAAIFVTLSGMLLHVHFVKVDHETLLIVGSLGVQLSSAYASGRESTTFIEMSRIKDIVINEAIHMQTIIYYLCILLKDPAEPDGVSSVVPLFQSSKPRLNCLVQVYRSCQEIIGQTR
ncbi:phosphatidylinositol N-acetylglucosaminyltransferase subunit H isoform X1 [Pangasianodon hypophthalmus]|uniref:phosphatidylinositol N-acetylglucosaminyltransferase subunit H isoform X1 n=1 Tax=Pangasianodon hypophthalmus TaxID=310915 RepID=UPI00147B8DAA|nr:phosphatidylinositol N-acetylglucosaminyltransferase subunit H isoform X1 [Pangasianodon hypophthalmus]XP_034169316.2 phosphatidylinositol N-acetylglucosaminyltransferase subunit H isoform X1 [Pangasianodon hypophthalmus]XP_034169317.1 phosphatidylinositol N-acetylglucosaminyltransferase subunit H isoform X1 [Pangasianodon hypophthalmus]